MCKRKRPRPHANAFTLIELLVVISIIVLLMALLLPALQRVRRQARAVVCQSRQREWGVRFAAYQSECDGRFPYHRGFAWPEGAEAMPRYGLRGSWPYGMKIFGEPDVEEIMLCPMASKPPALVHPFPHRYFGETFLAWVEQVPPGLRKSNPEWNYYIGRDVYVGSYAVNGRLASKIAGKVKPSALPTLFDSRVGFCQFEDASSDAPPPWEDWERSLATDTQYMRASAMAINRHQGSINVLFLDGAVRRVGLKELWTLQWHEQFDTTGPWTKAGGVSPIAWPQWMRNFKDY